MKRIFRILAVAVIFLSTAPAMAQTNVGHCNTDSLLVLMPEYKMAMTQLETLQAQYETDIEEMRLEMEDNAKRLEANQATWTPLRIQQAQASLQESYQKLQEYAQLAQRELNAKEQELLTPVLEKLQNAINAVGEEKGLDYVLDSSRGRGAVIFKKDDGDISNDVKAKLGIL